MTCTVGQEKVTILLRVIETKIIGNDFLADAEGPGKKNFKIRTQGIKSTG